MPRQTRPASAHRRGNRPSKRGQRPTPARHRRLALSISPEEQERLVTSPVDEAVRLLREIRRRVRNDPAFKPQRLAPRPGRPRGTTKMDAEGATLFLAVEIMGVRPADALRAIGRDFSSGSRDYDWLRRRVNTFRREVATLVQAHRPGSERLTPEEVQGWRDSLTRHGSFDPLAILTKVAARNPILFSKPKTTSE